MGFDLSEINPVSAISGGLQTLGGLGQALFSGVNKANSNYANYLKTYTPNKSIGDYYNDAFNNVSKNPFNSLTYQNSLNTSGAALAFGNAAVGERKGGLGNIGSLVNGYNQSTAAAAAQAESQNRANIALEGQAAQVKTREDAVPFNLEKERLEQLARAAAKTKSDGLQNIFGGLSTIAGGVKSSDNGTSKVYKYNMPYRPPNAAYYQQNGMGIPSDEQLPNYNP